MNLLPTTNTEPLMRPGGGTYFIGERPHTVLVVASWESVAGLQRVEAPGCQAEAAGRMRSLPLLGHRCVPSGCGKPEWRLHVEGGGYKAQHHMLSGHSRLPAGENTFSAQIDM